MTHVPREHREELESHANVVGTGVGPKRVDEQETDEESLVVLVRTKKDEADLDAEDVVPQTVDIDGTTLPTDVQEVGDVTIQDLGGRYQARPMDQHSRKGRWRPSPGGISVGHPEVSAGTLGTTPLRTEDGKTVVLTNAHVGAPLGKAQVGDPLLQPGPADGGTDDDAIGHLADFATIDPQSANKSDSALVEVDPQAIDRDILTVGDVEGWTEPQTGTVHAKSGRTTGYTEGRLRARDVRIKVGGYVEGQRVVFEGVDAFTGMSSGGDSGSLIGIEKSDGFYGTNLLFAGSNRITLGIPMSTVQSVHGSLTPVDLGSGDGGQSGGSGDEKQPGSGNPKQPGSGDPKQPGSGDGSKPGSGKKQPDQPRDFQSIVADYLTEEYGAGAVTTDVRGADFAVDAGLVRLRVTVVNSQRAAVDTIRQRLDDTRYSLPIVVFPSEEPVTYIERGFGLVGITR